MYQGKSLPGTGIESGATNAEELLPDAIGEVRSVLGGGGAAGRGAERSSDWSCFWSCFNSSARSKSALSKAACQALTSACCGSGLPGNANKYFLCVLLSMWSPKLYHSPCFLHNRQMNLLPAIEMPFRLSCPFSDLKSFAASRPTSRYRTCFAPSLSFPRGRMCFAMLGTSQSQYLHLHLPLTLYKPSPCKSRGDKPSTKSSGVSWLMAFVFSVGSGA
mmetsp:Transcript_101010/g.216391  ORF Transcript_101010/g.216391 Transcript_101010/m.216391 type:complete len:218 (-) Transcript_101010:214-867(-)